LTSIHGNLHVRGYREEGTTTTPFDMAVLNDIDRFHLVMDVAERVPQMAARTAHLKQRMRDKGIEHKQYILRNGQDLPEVRDWNGQANPRLAPRTPFDPGQGFRHRKG
jgi:xylulose-5-phosphate/fructose-6-phosphate phosphoketolase